MSVSGKKRWQRYRAYSATDRSTYLYYETQHRNYLEQRLTTNNDLKNMK